MKLCTCPCALKLPSLHLHSKPKFEMERLAGLQPFKPAQIALHSSIFEEHPEADAAADVRLPLQAAYARERTGKDREDLQAEWDSWSTALRTRDLTCR